MLEPCPCMVEENGFGDSVCLRCRSDWYGCDCPMTHTKNCPNNPINKREIKVNHKTAALELADLIVSMTDPKLTRWRKDQLEKIARAKARNYIKNVEASK